MPKEKKTASLKTVSEWGKNVNVNQTLVRLVEKIFF